MRKRNSIIGLKIVLCAIVLMVALSGAGCEKIGRSENDAVTKDRSAPLSEMTSGGEAGQDPEEIQDGQSDAAEEERLRAEEENRLSQLQEQAAQKLTGVAAYLALMGSEKTTTEFVAWLRDQCGDEVIQALAQAEAGDCNSVCYAKTKSSLFVLSDRFLDNRDYSLTVTGNGASDTAGITFAGDICLEEDGFVLDHYDTTAGLWECISPSIIEQTNTADVFMLNNEFSISERGEPLAGKYYTFRAMPSRISILQELGTDIASLANNHVYDYGAEAMMDTARLLREAGIVTVGGGDNKAEAEKVIYLNVNGLKIGFVSASRAEKLRYTPQATDDSPGIFLMYDPERLLEVTRDAAGRCDYLIAYIHWGTEDSRYYEDYQHDLAKQIFDAGADIIIGGHPHVLQGIEYIDGKPVVYSLGDFWFNHETKYTALIHIDVSVGGLSQMTIIPCLQSHFTTTMIEEAGERAAFMQYVRELSNSCEIGENGEICGQ